MNITLYQCNDDNNVVAKSLLQALVVPCGFVEPLDLDTPQITINLANHSNYNYCSLSVGGITYYYYITGRTINKHNITLSLELDVLKTYQTSILTSMAHVVRSASNYDLYLQDNLITNEFNVQRTYHKLANGFDTSNQCYVLMLGGM